MSQNGERTEEATPRRREKAREDGKVVSSRYAVISVQFIVAFAYLSGLDEQAGPALRQWKLWLASAFESRSEDAALISPSIDWTVRTLQYFLFAGLATTSSAFAAQMAVSQGHISAKGLKPNPGKILNFGKLKNQLVEGSKSLALAVLALLIFSLALAFYWQDIVAWCVFLTRMSVLGQLHEQSRQLYGLGKWCCLLFLLIGLVDYSLAKRRLENQLKMSKQELKEEFKEGNGNPEVKGRIRRIMKEMSGKRMMAQVPKATVVITNPTHYAIAIRYESDEMTVPIVLAKGVDHTALRIRKLALEREIPIIENPPLAQALYKSVEIGQEIPLHLYRAVAEVLAYVYRVLGRNAAR